MVIFVYFFKQQLGCMFTISYLTHVLSEWVDSIFKKDSKLPSLCMSNFSEIRHRLICGRGSRSLTQAAVLLYLELFYTAANTTCVHV
jgi:hypothetical protein